MAKHKVLQAIHRKVQPRQPQAREEVAKLVLEKQGRAGKNHKPE